MNIRVRLVGERALTELPYVVGSHFNDARMTRWPVPFPALPLLHQVWGLNPSKPGETKELTVTFDAPGTAIASEIGA